MIRNKKRNWLALVLVFCMVCTVMAMPIQAQEAVGPEGRETSGAQAPEESEGKTKPEETDGTIGTEMPEASASEETVESETVKTAEETTDSEAAEQAPLPEETTLASFV